MTPTHEERFVSSSDGSELWRPVTVTRVTWERTYFTDAHGHECFMRSADALTELRPLRQTRRLLCGCVAGETVEKCVPCGEHERKQDEPERLGACSRCGGSTESPVGCLNCCRDCGYPCGDEKDAEAFHVDS